MVDLLVNCGFFQVQITFMSLILGLSTYKFFVYLIMFVKNIS